MCLLTISGLVKDILPVFRLIKCQEKHLVLLQYLQLTFSLIERPLNPLSNCLYPQINLLLSEPYFSVSSLPWHDLYMWYARTSLVQRLSANATVLPRGATLKAIAVQFDHLWKIRAPVGVCEGFDISHFDKVIGVSFTKYLQCICLS